MGPVYNLSPHGGILTKVFTFKVARYEVFEVMI